MNFLIFLNPVPLQKREYNNIGLRNMKKMAPCDRIFSEIWLVID